MEAGEAWWVQFDARRLVVLVDGDDRVGLRGIQVVAPSGVEMTGLGVEIEIHATKGLDPDGVVRIGFPRPGYHPCTWLTDLREQDLMEWAGRVSPEKLAEIRQALQVASQSQEWTPQDRARFDEIRDAAVRHQRESASGVPPAARPD